MRIPAKGGVCGSPRKRPVSLSARRHKCEEVCVQGRIYYIFCRCMNNIVARMAVWDGQATFVDMTSKDQSMARAPGLFCNHFRETITER